MLLMERAISFAHKSCYRWEVIARFVAVQALEVDEVYDRGRRTGN